MYISGPACPFLTSLQPFFQPMLLPPAQHLDSENPATEPAHNHQSINCVSLKHNLRNFWNLLPHRHIDRARHLTNFRYNLLEPLSVSLLPSRLD